MIIFFAVLLQDSLLLVEWFVPMWNIISFRSLFNSSVKFLSMPYILSPDIGCTLICLIFDNLLSSIPLSSESPTTKIDLFFNFLKLIAISSLKLLLSARLLFWFDISSSSFDESKLPWEFCISFICVSGSDYQLLVQNLRSSMYGSETLTLQWQLRSYDNTSLNSTNLSPPLMWSSISILWSLNVSFVEFLIKT